jgi:pimeloyl-ACP methyl ester carboxylesterase
MQHVNLASGITLHFVETGRGPPVILLHGGMGDCASWSRQSQTFAATFRVLAYSRRYSYPNQNPPPNTPHSIRVDVADLHELMQARCIDSAHLLGTSYGALVVLAYALAHPRSVRSLTLAEPPLHAWLCRTSMGTNLYRQFLLGIWSVARSAFDSGDEARALRILVDGIGGTRQFHALPSNELRIVLRNAAAMAALTRSDEPFPDLDRAEVARLAMPTLLVHGEHTSDMHKYVIEELSSVLRQAERAVIKNAGHASARENPMEFNHAVRAFLRRVTQGVAPADPGHTT